MREIRVRFITQVFRLERNVKFGKAYNADARSIKFPLRDATALSGSQLILAYLKHLRMHQVTEVKQVHEIYFGEIASW